MKNSRLKILIKSIISEVLKENPTMGSELHHGYQGGLDPDVNTGGFDAGNGFQTNVWESKFKKPADWNKIVDIHKKLSRDKRIKLYDMAIDRITAKGFYEIDHSDINQEIYTIIKQGGLNNLKEDVSEEIQIPFKDKLKKFLNVGTILDAKIRSFYLQNLKETNPKAFDYKIENNIKPRIISKIMDVYNRDATSINKQSLMHHLKRENFPDNQIQFIVHLVDDMRLTGSGESVVDSSPKPFISVRQGQEVDKSGKQFKDGVTKISDVEVDGRKVKYTDSSSAGWGSSTWKVQSNGTIKMVSEDWDTSG